MQRLCACWLPATIVALNYFSNHLTHLIWPLQTFTAFHTWKNALAGTPFVSLYDILVLDDILVLEKVLDSQETNLSPGSELISPCIIWITRCGNMGFFIVLLVVTIMHLLFLEITEQILQNSLLQLPHIDTLTSPLMHRGKQLLKIVFLYQLQSLQYPWHWTFICNDRQSMIVAIHRSDTTLIGIIRFGAVTLQPQ